jgi:hypothetical protein
MLRIHRSIPRWRIVFSTFFQCMSFYTARVKTGPKADVRVESDLAPIADVGRAHSHVAEVPIGDFVPEWARGSWDRREPYHVTRRPTLPLRAMRCSPLTEPK